MPRRTGSKWFDNPFGMRKHKGGKTAKLTVSFVHSSDLKTVMSCVLTSEMDHAATKESFMFAAELHVPIDHIAVYTLGKDARRVPCVFDAFFARQNEKGPVVLITAPEPWQRALERADMVRYGVPGSESICFQPEDVIFSGADGRVNDQKTPYRFIGARLCERFQITGYIQSGGFGRGWEAKELKTGEKMFIKTFRSFADRAPRKEKLSREQAIKLKASQEAAVRKEIEVLLHPLFRDAVSNDAIVSNELCYGNVSVPYTGRSGEMFFIATKDLCDGGELFNYICPTSPPYVRPFTEPTALRVFRQIASAVAHMHRIGCYHRDLKLENLVLDGQFNVKLMDFGSCKFVDQMEEVVDDAGEISVVTNTYAGIGTRGYKPPDVVGGQYYDPAPFDVWSAGVILFFMVAGDKILKELGGRNCFRLFEFMATKNADPQFAKYYSLLSPPGVRDHGTNAPPHTAFWEMFGKDLDISDELINLLNRMFDLDPKTRITMDEVCEHDWFDEDDAEDDEYFAELRSRPTTASRDQVLKLSVQSMDDALRLCEKAAKIAMKANTGDDTITILENRFEVGQDSQGNSLYTMALEDRDGKIRCTCQWHGGDLGSWLNFVVKVKEALRDYIQKR
eukprot:m.335953 g.335953  ORF g.335953 m.335953 type:complete len:621 (-) comp17722_c0_seq1:73-1935(-)